MRALPCVATSLLGSLHVPERQRPSFRLTAYCRNQARLRTEVELQRSDVAPQLVMTTKLSWLLDFYQVAHRSHGFCAWLK